VRLEQEGDTGRPRPAGPTNEVGIVSSLFARGLHGFVLESIGASIASGELAAGQQIVPEAFADKFGVSRTAVREVLRVLEAKGMVGARPRTGTRVRPETWWNLLDPDVIRWRSTGPDSSRQLEELLGIRGAIEPLAARNAASAATPEDVQDLVDALEQMSDAVENHSWDHFTEADVSFHRALLRASGSLVIAQLADPIEAALRVRHKLRLVPAELSAKVIPAHEAILEAVVAHDDARAELASRQIVDVAGSEILASLIQRNSDSGVQRSTEIEGLL
jgi:DNA-binding FadR family transcriptional regulator